MNLQGKSINFFGDSITEGHGVADIENNRYDNIVKKRCNLKTVHNYGIGGTRIAHQSVASEKPRYDLSFCGRAYNLDPNADITVVFGGTNDYGHGDAHFGELKDKTPSTFCGAVDFLINILMELYPKMKFIFMTPARREGDEYPSNCSMKKKDARPLKEYTEVIKAKGKEYGIPVLDLYENLGLNPNDEQVKNIYVPDGLHFNDEGHKIIAECLIDFMKSLN